MVSRTHLESFFIGLTVFEQGNIQNLKHSGNGVYTNIERKKLLTFSRHLDSYILFAWKLNQLSWGKLYTVGLLKISVPEIRWGQEGGEWERSGEEYHTNVIHET